MTPFSTTREARVSVCSNYPVATAAHRQQLLDRQVPEYLADCLYWINIAIAAFDTRPQDGDDFPLAVDVHGVADGRWELRRRNELMLTILEDVAPVPADTAMKPMWTNAQPFFYLQNQLDGVTNDLLRIGGPSQFLEAVMTTQYLFAFGHLAEVIYRDPVNTFQFIVKLVDDDQTHWLSLEFPQPEKP